MSFGEMVALKNEFLKPGLGTTGMGTRTKVERFRTELFSSGWELHDAVLKMEDAKAKTECSRRAVEEALVGVCRAEDIPRLRDIGKRVGAAKKKLSEMSGELVILRDELLVLLGENPRESDVPQEEIGGKLNEVPDKMRDVGGGLSAWVRDAILGNIDNNYAYWLAHSELGCSQPRLHVALLRTFLDTRGGHRKWGDLSLHQKRAHVNSALTALVEKNRLEMWKDDLGSGSLVCYRPNYPATSAAHKRCAAQPGTR